MRYPAKLKKGAIVGLVSPSSPISPERVELCGKAVEGLGYRVKLSDNHALSKGGYMAGEEKLRAQWMNTMFADPQVEAIFCVRGGGGATRIIPYLQLEMIKQNPKIFVGYSDVTCLHLLLNQQCDLVTFHGPMVSSNMIDHFDAESQKSFFDCLNADRVYEYRAPGGLPLKPLRSGKAEGILTGGNLTLMAASLGTPYEIDTKGKIIFIEETGEHIGNIDRHIYQLRDGGKLKQAAGVILGQFTGCHRKIKEYGIEEILLDAVADLDLPVLSGVQSGHGFPMISLPMGARCGMDADQCAISFAVERGSVNKGGRDGFT